MKAIFADDVVQATELKKNQKYWLDRARQRGGVTIVQGRVADLVLAPRRQVAANAQGVLHARLVGQFVLEMTRVNQQLADSAVFPWFKDLDDEERRSFYRELVETFFTCLVLEDWRRFDELLEDWQATAEANQRPEVLATWRTRGNPADYALMKLPTEPPRSMTHAGAV